MASLSNGGLMAITTLTGLLHRGGPWERREAATTLFELCKLPENRRRRVREGAALVLVDFATDGSACAVVREAERVVGTRNRKKRKGERKKKAAGARMLFHRCSLCSTGCNRSAVSCGLISLNQSVLWQNAPK